MGVCSRVATIGASCVGSKLLGARATWVTRAERDSELGKFAVRLLICQTVNSGDRTHERESNTHGEFAPVPIIKLSVASRCLSARGTHDARIFK
jgi:hypothetical protein